MVAIVLALLLLVSSSVFALPSSGCASPPTYDTPSQWIPGPTHGVDALAREALEKLTAHKIAHPTSNCTLETAYRRKEWDTFTRSQKLAYIDAVKCITTKPSISGDLVPGARNRLDDFVGTHINQTGTIHLTGNFLSWHRYFIWAYETALREECGYKGYQPYADWGRYSNAVIGSPLFDGSDTSISGNGVYKSHPPVVLIPPGPNPPAIQPVIYPGVGGGCLHDGPFKGTQVNLGPMGLTDPNNTAPNPRKDGFGYNPRCIRRDLSVQSARGASDANTTKLITQQTNIADFQGYMQGPEPYGVNEIGVHTAGHFLIGGDPGGDFFTSPGDMWFYFHHANIDRIWWIWQNLDIETRTNVIAGTLTLLNNPPSRNATLDDIMDLGVNDGFRGMKLRDAMSTTGGPFCYIYE